MRGRVFDAEVRVRQNRLVEPAADERAEARRVDAVDDGGAAGREPRQRRRRVSVLCHRAPAASNPVAVISTSRLGSALARLSAKVKSPSPRSSTRRGGAMLSCVDNFSSSGILKPS